MVKGVNKYEGLEEEHEDCVWKKKMKIEIIKRR